VRQEVVLAVPADRRRAPRRVATVVLVAMAVLGAAYLGGAPVLSRRDYGTYAFWGVPGRVDYCGHRYVERTQITGSATQIWNSYRDQADRWTLTSRTFTGRPIFAVLTDRFADSSVCAVALYVPLGDGRWETYALRGGR
jgi:hypothetical protein